MQYASQQQSLCSPQDWGFRNKLQYFYELDCCEYFHVFFQYRDVSHRPKMIAPENPLRISEFRDVCSTLGDFYHTCQITSDTAYDFVVSIRDYSGGRNIF